MAAGLEEAAHVDQLLEQTLASDKRLQLRGIAALGALGSAGTKQGPIVAERLHQLALDSDKDVKLAAIAALGAFGGATTKEGPATAEFLKDFALDSDKDVKLAALTALGAFGGADTTSFLQEMTNDRVVSVRQAAKTALDVALKPRQAQAESQAGIVRGGYCTLQ